MENADLMKKRTCVIARKLGISLEKATKMKADYLNPPKKAKKEPITIKESSDGNTNL